MKFILIILIVIGSLTAGAQEEKNEKIEGRYVGGQGGLATIKGGEGNHFTYSIKIGTKIAQTEFADFVIGANIARLNDELTLFGVTFSQTYTAFAVEMLASQILNSGSYFGVRGGPMIIAAQIEADDLDLRATSITSVFGPVVGYEFPLTDKVNLVLDFSYLFVGSTDLNFPGLSGIEVDSTSALLSQIGVSVSW